MKGLGKSSGTALLWESRHYQMRMHYIGRRELRDFSPAAVNAAGGEVVLRERRVGGRRVLDGVLPTRRHLAAVPFGPFWGARIAEGAAGERLRFRTPEGRARSQEAWKFQDVTGREIYSHARESKADFSAARNNATGRRHLDTPPPPTTEPPKHGKSTLTQKSHDTTHKLEWGVSSGLVKIRDFQNIGDRRRLETAPPQAATPALRDGVVEWEFTLTISGDGPAEGAEW